MDNLKMVVLGGLMIVAAAILFVPSIGSNSGLAKVMFIVHFIGGWGFGLAGLLGSERAKKKFGQQQKGS